MKKIYFFGLVVFILCSEVFSQVQSEGEKLFRLNRPEAAIPVLEKEIALPGADPVFQPATHGVEHAAGIVQYVGHRRCGAVRRRRSAGRGGFNYNTCFAVHRLHDRHGQRRQRHCGAISRRKAPQGR